MSDATDNLIGAVGGLLALSLVVGVAKKATDSLGDSLSIKSKSKKEKSIW